MTDEIQKENTEAPKPPVDDMVPMKPPTVPLFKIPDAVLNSMSKEVAPDTGALNNPVEWIIQQRKMAEAQVTGAKESQAPSPQVAPTIAVPTAPAKKSKVPVVAWGGNDLNEESLTMLLYLVLKEASKDKKIKKLLKEMKIEVYDINGDLLWP